MICSSVLSLIKAFSLESQQRIASFVSPQQIEQSQASSKLAKVLEYNSAYIPAFSRINYRMERKILGWIKEDFGEWAHLYKMVK